MTRFKFIVILPTTKYNLAAVEKALTNNFNWGAVDDPMEETFVKLTIPQFNLEHEIDLNSALKSMGITDLFSKKRADLAGMHFAIDFRSLS